MKSQNLAYMPAVDHLRGLAAILIVFYHGSQLIGHQLIGNREVALQRWHVTDNPFLSFILEGHTAVALFFVLSGFIFTFGNRDRDLSWLPFLKNRILRIAPLMITLLMLGVAAFPNRFTLSSFLQHLLLQSNTSGAGTFGPLTSMFWTISAECQFYLIFPFLLAFTQRYGARYLLRLIFLVVLLRALAAFTGGNIRDMTYWSLVGRVDQFLIGMVLGYYYQPGMLKSWLTRSTVMIAGAMTLTMLMFVFHVSMGGWPQCCAHLELR